MSDYIKREDVLGEFTYDDLDEYCTPQIMAIVGDIPSADVAPARHGRWTHERLPSTSGGSYAVIRCSECQLQVPIYETRFCPNCGARMDGEYDE